MNFSIAAIMCRLFATHHKLCASWWLWRRLVRCLRARGMGYRESGAFLIGRRAHDGRARIVDFVLYDDLDPNSLATGIIRFDGRHFGALWELCKLRGLTVVADVHTHPGSADQSFSDQAHPMIARAGHIAFIVGRYAQAPIHLADVGMYQYLGDRRWETIPVGRRNAFFHVGL